jgi:hypothetical protein
MRDATLSCATFQSRKDVWLVGVLLAAAVGDLLGAVVLAVIGPPSIVLKVFLPVVLVAAASVIVWSLLGTSYRLRGEELLIRCGPFHSRVRVTKIDSVSPTHNSLAAPALSLDRLELRLVNPSRLVFLSPAEPAKFIASLKAIKPTITVSG